MIFAKKWHDGQMRKTGEPYYSHPFAVAATVAEYRFATNIIIAAILHDVIEDSECTGELIVAEFNSRIADMVRLLTRVICDEEGNIIRLSIETVIDNIIKIDDKEAMLIKGVDRLHNLETSVVWRQENSIRLR